MMETARSTPAFAVGGVVPAFLCVACGDEVVIMPGDAPRGICEACCHDHDFVYERFERGHRCQHCFAEPDRDWYDD